ncbi:MAG TPA: hypothetical protein VF473_11185 [Cyclobacteriaceae bacterium]
MIGFRKIFPIGLILCVLIACEGEKHIFEGPYFVRFTDESITQKESHSAPIEIQVHNAGPAPKSDVVVNYAISGSARQGIDYVITGTPGKVKIKSGQFFGNIEVKLINNANNILRSQDIVFTLVTIENDTDGLQVGQGKSQIGKTFTLTINDDCILGGDYYGIHDNKDVPLQDITITSTDCEHYILSNWDIYIFTFPQVRSLTFIDNGDNTITIPPQKDPTLPSDAATIDGFGVVDPTTRTISMTVRLVDFDGSPSFTFNLIPD